MKMTRAWRLPSGAHAPQRSRSAVPTPTHRLSSNASGLSLFAVDRFESSHRLILACSDPLWIESSNPKPLCGGSRRRQQRQRRQRHGNHASLIEGAAGAAAAEAEAGDPLAHDLQGRSAFSIISTMSVKSLEVEGNHSNGNNDVESKPILSHPACTENDLTSILITRTEIGASSQIGSPAVNKMKGFLCSFYTISEKLFVFCGALAIWSFQYPLGSDAQHEQGIIMASAIIFIISLGLVPLAAYLKDSESADGVGMELFKWLSLLILLGLCAELCVILHFRGHISKSVLWILGIVVSIIIVLIWAWVFYVKVPQEKLGYQTEKRMLPERADSEHASAAPSLPRPQV